MGDPWISVHNPHLWMSTVGPEGRVGEETEAGKGFPNCEIVSPCFFGKFINSSIFFAFYIVM